MIKVIYAEIAEILKTLYHGGNGLGSVSAWYAEDGIHCLLYTSRCV